MRFEPENALESALVRATTEAGARPEFYRLLMASNLIVAGDAGRPLPPGATLKLRATDRFRLAFASQGGRSFHPVFSSTSRLEHFAPQGLQHFRLLGRDLFATARGAHFVLNPGSQFGKELSPDELAYWLSQLLGRRLNKEGLETVAASAKHPVRLTKALGVLFVNRQVASARLAEIRRAGAETRCVLAVETDSSWRKLSGEIATAVDAVTPEFALELLRLNGAAQDLLTQQLLAIAPFYERRHFQELKEQK
jgi:hypothetical protein